MARERGRPVFLHLRTVRFLGHAGSDAEISYRTPAEIEADYAAIRSWARPGSLRQRGATVTDLLARLTTRSGTRSSRGRRAGRRRRWLRSAAEVMAPLAPRRPGAVARDGRALTRSARTGSGQRRTLAESINATLGRAARPPTAG